MTAILRANSCPEQFSQCCLRWERFTLFLVVFVGVAFLLSMPVQAGTTNYFVRGVLKDVKKDANQLIIAHEEVPNFMEAMTMPFNVKDAGALTNFEIGAKITFQLHVNETESW